MEEIDNPVEAARLCPLILALLASFNHHHASSHLIDHTPLSSAFKDPPTRFTVQLNFRILSRRT